MPMYLTRFSMAPEAWARLIQKPEDRREIISQALTAAGGKLHGYWYAFGEHDGYVLSEAPNQTAIATALVTVAASGSFSSVATTVLITVEEMLESLNAAQAVSYRPPGG